MSNFQKQKGQYKYSLDRLVEFLMLKDFSKSMRMNVEEGIVLSKGEHFTTVPYQPLLTEQMVESVLQKAGLTFTEFEEHLRSVAAMEEMNTYIDIGLAVTPKKQSPKD